MEVEKGKREFSFFKEEYDEKMAQQLLGPQETLVLAN
jgi:hypothetical protein